MIEFLREQALQLFSLLALADVATHLRCANDRSRFIAQWRHRHRHVDAPPVLGDADGLVMMNALAASQTREYLLLLSVQIGRNDAGDVLPDHFVRLIPEYVGRARIPGGDSSIQRL